MKTTQIRIILVLIIIAALGYYAFTAKDSRVETSDKPSNGSGSNTIMTTLPAGGTSQPGSDTELAEDLQVYEGWEAVEAEGYYFMHPGYFIQENEDHYIMAYEPRVGQEFSALAIFKPVAIEDPVADLNQKIVDSEGLGVSVVTEPTRTSIEGTKDAYYIEYEIESGPTTGLNKYYLLQSPSTDQWVAIEYTDNETAEAIKDSFNFID